MEQNTNTNNQATGERTFTQEEVNRIVSERLNKEKNKGEAAFAEREQLFAEREKQLANREALADLRDQLKEMGLPDALLPVLNVQDKDALKTALDALQTYVNRKIEKEKPYKVLENKLPEQSERDTTDADIRKAMGLR